MSVQGSEDSRLTPHASPIMAFLCSLVGLTLSLWGLFEWDVPLTRFVRSLNDFHIDHLANPWLAHLSDVGDRMGRGEWLAILSLAMLAVGYGLKWSSWKEAGWVSLLAHGLAALTSNLLKHLIGRPRPKFMHAGNFELTPAGGSGWDSFPSGHATASFAVAAVLAEKFPMVRWVMVGMAMAITVSRILRGAHFLTDTIGGAVLGYMIGTVVSNPWRLWRSSLLAALVSATPWVVALFALVTIIGHRPPDLWPAPQLMAGGPVVTLIGLAAHMLHAMRAGQAPTWLSKGLTQALIGLGLGMTTGSLWVATAMVCVSVAHWVWRQAASPPASGQRIEERYALTREAVFSVLVLLGLFVSMELRGVLPIM